MKKLLILTLSFVMLSTYAQKGKYNVADQFKDFKGFLITETGDTVKGTVKILDMFQMQMYPPFKADDTSLPSQIGGRDNSKYYESENGTKWYSTKFTNLKAPDDPKKPGGPTPQTFLLTIEGGPITLFDYNFLDESVSPTKNEIKSYMQLQNGDLVEVASLLLGFPKKMSGWVSDYPELAKKIADKEKGYGVLGLNAIVREYNAWYIAKNPGFSMLK